MDTFGFKEIKTTEHDFARYLRKHKAIDNWQTVGSSNVWYGPDGKSVALCLYDNEKSECRYFVKSGAMVRRSSRRKSYVCNRNDDRANGSRENRR